VLFVPDQQDITALANLAEVPQEVKATENAVYILAALVIVVVAATAGFFARSLCLKKH